MKNSRKVTLTADQVKELKTLCAAAKAVEEAREYLGVQAAKPRYTRIETTV